MPLQLTRSVLALCAATATPAATGSVTSSVVTAPTSCTPEELSEGSVATAYTS